MSCLLGSLRRLQVTVSSLRARPQEHLPRRPKHPIRPPMELRRHKGNIVVVWFRKFVSKGYFVDLGQITWYLKMGAHRIWEWIAWTAIFKAETALQFRSCPPCKKKKPIHSSGNENLTRAAKLILENTWIPLQPPIPPAVRFEYQHCELWAAPSDAQFLLTASGERNRRIWAYQSTLALWTGAGVSNTAPAFLSPSLPRTSVLHAPEIRTCLEIL